MSCSCKKSGVKKQPTVIKKINKPSSTPNTQRQVTKPAQKRVIIRRPI